MRQILFRGKDVKTKQWRYGYLQFHYVQGRDSNGLVFVGISRIFDQENNQAYDVITDTVGQFTGELDSDGKRIFEGDKVLIKGGVEAFGCYEFQEVLEVRYDGMEFMFYDRELHKSHSYNHINSDNKFVVGDIYE